MRTRRPTARSRAQGVRVSTYSSSPLLGNQDLGLAPPDVRGGICSARHCRDATLHSKDQSPREPTRKSRRQLACPLGEQSNKSKTLASSWRGRPNRRFERDSCSSLTAEFRTL